MIDSSTLQGTSLADVIGFASWNIIKIKIYLKEKNSRSSLLWSLATIFITPRQKIGINYIYLCL